MSTRLLARGRRLIEQANQILQASTVSEVDRYAKYRDDPAGFAADVLKNPFTPLQQKMAESLLIPPYRTLVPSANSQGKSNAASAIVLWWYSTRVPAKVITTAPKDEQLKNILWAEIRRLARGMRYPLPFQPKACEIRRSADDFAIGVVAKDDTRFHGKHGANMLFVVEEGTGVSGDIFTAISSMFSPPGHAWLVIFNPTTTESHVYVEFSNVEAAQRKQVEPSWNIVPMPALKHPNIDAGLRGQPEPVPHAMTVRQFDTMLRQWSTVIPADPCKPVGSDGGPAVGDVVWPPVAYCERQPDGSLRHAVYGPPVVYRPGPEAEARLLARFPSQGSTAVWGEADWQSACRDLVGQGPLPEPHGETLEVPEIGCDLARFGDDSTAIHARVGCVSLLHEEASKRPVNETAGRLIEVARWLADWFNARKEHMVRKIDPEDIPMKIDDTGMGGGLTDFLRGKDYNVVPVNSSELPNDAERYPNKRSELWFVTADRARRGEIDLSRLPLDALDELRRQALTATWKLDQDGRRVVEKKEDSKKRLKRSPDGIDAMNLAYYVAGVRGPSSSVTTERTTWRAR